MAGQVSDLNRTSQNTGHFPAVFWPMERRPVPMKHLQKDRDLATGFLQDLLFPAKGAEEMNLRVEILRGMQRDSAQPERVESASHPETSVRV